MVDFLRRNANWLAVALLVSLGANLFLGGMMAGRLLHHGMGGPRMEMMGGAGQVNWIVKRIAEDLPAAQQDVFRDAMNARKDQLVAMGKELREAREAVKAAIQTKPFDRAAYDNAATAMSQRQTTFSAELADAVGDSMELAAGKPVAN
ncbi:periplasmic heavy metal sensor [Hypericibacter sp.]|uniref:periplasmic heavy metal sensor n=1 Tax=Hypericibacter sp. TaxID=2705401 RepID=UPI003D6D3ABB